MMRILIIAISLTGFTWVYADMGMCRMPAVNMKRHRKYMRGEIPNEYKGKSNPYKPTPEILKLGKKVYKTYCASCHGSTGKGDGPAAKNLDWEPSDLSFIIKRPIARDDYLYWTISEGGIPVGSPMPAFKDILSEKEIWAVILYMRNGFK